MLTISVNFWRFSGTAESVCAFDTGLHVSLACTTLASAMQVCHLPVCCHISVLVKRPSVWCCRALRNCHWVGDLWAGAMRAMELSGADDSEIAARYDAALQVGARFAPGCSFLRQHR